jgi:hypothetical protein
MQKQQTRFGLLRRGMRLMNRNRIHARRWVEAVTYLRHESKVGWVLDKECRQ